MLQRSAGIVMSEHPYAEVFVIFLPTEAGGRTRPINLDDHGYRPHFRVAPDGEYLGVNSSMDQKRFDLATKPTRQCVSSTRRRFHMMP